MSQNDSNKDEADLEKKSFAGDEETPETGATTVEPKEETPKEGDAPKEGEKAPEEDAQLPSYRKEEEPKKEPETVPLSKFLELKNELKELKRSSQSNTLTSEDLKTFADEAGLEHSTVTKMAALIAKQAREEALAELDSKVQPVLKEKISADNNRLFEEDFSKRIASKYPELVEKKEAFRKIAFSKDFLHLKTLDDIQKEFFPIEKKTKEAPEGGSVSGENLPEKIDFSKVKGDDELHSKILKDPKLRQKYYDWQDSQGLY